MEGKIWLRVQHAEADDAKSLGARWDEGAQRWWVAEALVPQIREDCPAWLAPLDHALRVDGTLRALASEQQCPKCCSPATVIALLASGTRAARGQAEDAEAWGPLEPRAVYLRDLKAIEDPELRMLLSKQWPGYRTHRGGPYRNRCRLCNYEFPEAELHAAGGPFYRLERAGDGAPQIHTVQVCSPTFFDAERTFAVAEQELSSALHARSAA